MHEPNIAISLVMNFLHFLYHSCACFVVVIFIVLTCFIIFCKVINRYWQRKGVYTLKPLICLGNTVEVLLQKKSFGESVGDFYSHLKANGKRFGGYYFLMRPAFVPCDLDLIKKILITDFDHFSDHPLHVNEDIDPLSGHLFALKGEKWKKLRMRLNPAFNLSKCKMMFDILIDCCRDLEIVIDNKVTNNEVIDIFDLVTKLSADILSTCAFGINGGGLRNSNSELQTYGTGYLHDNTTLGSILHLISFIFPEFFNIFKMKTISDHVTNFFLNTTRDIVKYREENNIVRNDLMQLLIQLKNEGQIGEHDSETSQHSSSSSLSRETLSTNQIAAQAFVFLVAGYETSSTTSGFCIYELALNHDLQNKARKEIEVVLEETGGKLTYDALSKMKFMDQCIYETLRKYPPMMTHSRICTKTYVVPNTNVTITKGTPVFISAYGLHMDPDYYPNPKLFDPDRFSEENKGSRPACTWIPFGEGPRMCIAYRFGLIQVKMGIVTLLKRYKFSLDSSTKVPMTIHPKNFLLQPSSDIRINAERIRFHSDDV